jgi:CheY-like chemotaxis protein
LTPSYEDSIVAWFVSVELSCVFFNLSGGNMPTILVIDDNRDDREFLKIVLEDAGYDVLEASEGRSGVQLYRQQPCDLVITDIFMPEQDGLETILELKQQFPDVRIIAVSGGGMYTPRSGDAGTDMALTSAKAFGAERVIQKPIRTHDLLATVQDLVPLEQ